MTTCPTCHQTIRPKTVKAVPDPNRDLSSLTRDDLFAHYKATAPAEDLAFWLRNARMSGELRGAFVDLRTESDRMPRAAFYRAFKNLQDAWRRESNARERAERIMAGYIMVADQWTNPADVVVVPTVFDHSEAVA